MLVNQTFIAKKSGVTQKTVSLYFKDRMLVGEKVRSRIDEVLCQYHYLPNFSAIAMKSDRFRRIGCVLLQYGSAVTSSQPHLCSYLNGASVALSQVGYSLVLEPVFVDLNTRKATFTEFFSMRSVDGIIGIAGGWVPSEVDAQVANLQLPTVWLNRNPDFDGVRTLLFDEHDAQVRLLEKLIAEGKKHFCWMGLKCSENELHYSRRSRYETMRQTLLRHRLGCEALFADNGSLESTRATVRELFRRSGEFDVIFFYNFHLLEQAMWLAQEAEWNRNHIRLAYFISENEYHSRRCEYPDAILLEESELGRNSVRFILSCLDGKDDATLLKPFPCRIPALESKR